MNWQLKPLKYHIKSLHSRFVFFSLIRINFIRIFQPGGENCHVIIPYGSNFRNFKEIWRIFMVLRSLRIYFNISKALKTVGFPFSEPFSVRNKTCGQGLLTMDWHYSPCALITSTPTAAEMSCKNHFSFIKKYYACYMLSNYTLSGLEITRKKNISSSHVLHATSKQVISSRLLEENDREMY